MERFWRQSFLCFLLCIYSNIYILLLIYIYSIVYKLHTIWKCLWIFLCYRAALQFGVQRVNLCPCSNHSLSKIGEYWCEMLSLCVHQPFFINSDALSTKLGFVCWWPPKLLCWTIDFEWLQDFQRKVSLRRTECNRDVGKWIIAKTIAISWVVNTVTVFPMALFPHKSVNGERKGVHKLIQSCCITSDILWISKSAHSLGFYKSRRCPQFA